MSGPVAEQQRNVVFTGPYYVVRGACKNAEDFVRMDTLIKLNILNADEVKKLKEKISENSLDYSGAIINNYFRVSEVIELSSIFFFGPAISNDKECVYHIQVTIWENLPETEQVKVIEKSSYCVGSFGELLWIDLGRVYMKANTWYTIGFILNGEATLRIENPLTEVDVEIEGRRKKVNFEFLNGSRQMPKMEFWLVPPSDMGKAYAQWQEVTKRETSKKRTTFWDILFERISSFFV